MSAKSELAGVSEALRWLQFPRLERRGQFETTCLAAPGFMTTRRRSIQLVPSCKRETPRMLSCAISRGYFYAIFEDL